MLVYIKIISVRSFNPLLTALAIVLIIMNVFAIAGLSIEQSRWVRIFTAAVFTTAFFFYFSKKTLLLLVALVSLLIADIFSLSYKYDFSKIAFFTLHGISYLLLFLHITKRANRNLLSRFQKFFSLGAFVLCTVVLLAFGITFRNEMHEYWHIIFFYFHGFSAIACLISALAFYDKNMNSFSLIYLISAVGLIFSDFTAFPAVYLKANSFYYFSRIFYVVGLSNLVRFAYLSRQSRYSNPEADPLTGVEEEEVETEKFYHDH